MPSLLPGYEYDIFISYRQNDNRSGWVTEFVRALQEELAATIKDPISVYYDSNPHDGLLESHNVDKSLEGKLKCLIFIPIISQTYCDPESFAWQHEFCAFNKLAKEDLFGRDIKLGNGNVASRILPILIHELDSDDTTTIENELGGVLRGINFIYKEAGVNRPLKPTDQKNDNQSKSDYRNQVNKAANAIKEIAFALRKPVAKRETIAHNLQSVTSNRSPSRRMKAVLTLLLLAVIPTASYFIYQSTKTPQPRSPVFLAVLPFADMSPNHDLEYLGDGVADEIITALGNAKGLKVIARSSSFQFKGKNESIQTMSNSLGAQYILEGSVKRSDDTIRITATLIESQGEGQLWSETFDHAPGNILLIQDEIAKAVALKLRTTLDLTAASRKQGPWNEDAYKFYQQGKLLWEQSLAYAESDNSKKAINYLDSSLLLDPEHAIVQFYLASCYYNLNDTTKGGYHLDQALRMDPRLAEAHAQQAYRYFQHYRFHDSFAEINTALSYDESNPLVLAMAGTIYRYFGKFDESVQFLTKAIELDPLKGPLHLGIGNTYFYMRQYQKAAVHFSKAREITHDQPIWLPMALLFDGKVSEAKEANQLEKDDLRRSRNSIMLDLYLNRIHQADSAMQSFRAKYYFDNPYETGMLLAFRGQKDEAFACFNRAYDRRIEGLAGHLLGNPLLDPIRNDARYEELKRKINFPK
jgi:TolB-like protein/Flp pilus assembly protein TadD